MYILVSDMTHHTCNTLYRYLETFLNYPNNAMDRVSRDSEEDARGPIMAIEFESNACHICQVYLYGSVDSGIRRMYTSIKGLVVYNGVICM